MMKRCRAAIWVRDTYRRTGRGLHGFSLHYNKQQCSRKAIKTLGGEEKFCKQHLELREYRTLLELDWHDEWEPRKNQW